ncbi:MAG: DUF2325 domain-containing protein [Deltaproteobacteria bacterium]|nr:DUF2325 domain-containing protein [Deltaproteobacteria bacterium]
MCINLVGGMDRLKRDYENVAKQCGINLRIFTGKESCLVDKMGFPDKIILFTDMISHKARTSVLQRSKTLGIPVIFLHSNGVSSLSRCFREL